MYLRVGQVISLVEEVEQLSVQYKETWDCCVIVLIRDKFHLPYSNYVSFRQK